jgi:hypothetical protein
VFFISADDSLFTGYRAHISFQTQIRETIILASMSPFNSVLALLVEVSLSSPQKRGEVITHNYLWLP